MHRRISTYSSSYIIEYLKVDLSGGKRIELILKDLSPSSLLLTADRIRPHFLYDPRREIRTYRHILRTARDNTPQFYGAFESNDLERYWLFLERVSGPLLWQAEGMDPWKDAARWLARLHEGFYSVGQGTLDSSVGHLLRYDRQFLEVWLIRAEEFLKHKHRLHDLAALRRFGQIANRYDRVVKRLLDLPASFIHREFYPSNIIMRKKPRNRAICPVDWELAAIGPSLMDLAALTSGEWSVEARRAMVTAYRETISQVPGGLPTLDEMMEHVEYCQLHLAVQFMGWAPDWSPPERHSQNWLREAIRLGEKLGL
ncbi:MAG: aminoglycoside phosphotransferase family protein [Pedosphaera sp.]|nr:aminoglycoside phosphotransferase family protein [Pedosphaera sp.]